MGKRGKAPADAAKKAKLSWAESALGAISGGDVADVEAIDGQLVALRAAVRQRLADLGAPAGEGRARELDAAKRCAKLEAKLACLRAWLAGAVAAPSLAGWPDSLPRGTGGALDLAKALASSKQAPEENHERDHALAIFMAIGFIADYGDADAAGLGGAINKTRALYEGGGGRHVASLTPLGKLLAEMLPACSPQVRATLLTALVASACYAECAPLLAVALGSDERSHFLCSRGKRAISALQELCSKLHAGRGGPLDVPATPAAAAGAWTSRLPTTTRAAAARLASSSSIAREYPGEFCRWVLTSDREPVVVVRAEVLGASTSIDSEDARRVRTYTFAARQGASRSLVMAAESERGKVSTRRGWALGLGRLWASWTRCMEAAVFFEHFSASDLGKPQARVDLGAGFSFVPKLKECGDFAERVKRAAEFAGGRSAILTETWVARLVEALVDSASGVPGELQLDLCALYCSNHGLCYYCCLPLEIAGGAAKEGAPAPLLAKRGVKRAEGPSNAAWKKLDHSTCAATSRAVRLARGRALLLRMAATCA